MNKKLLLTVLLISTVALLQGCAGVVVGGAAATASAAHDRRTVGVMVDDQSIEIKARDAIASNKELAKGSNVTVISYNMIVLLTGQVSKPEYKSQIEAIVSGIARVRRVVNEIEVGELASIGEQAGDAALLTKVKYKLTSIDLPDFDATRVKVVVELGQVFLMGLVSQQEGQAVIELVRQVDDVARVVNVFEYY